MSCRSRNDCFVKTDVTFKREFRAKLSTAQVVDDHGYGFVCPAGVDCDAHACISFCFSEDLSSVRFSIDVLGVEDLSSIQLHMGDAGHNGCTFAHLYGKDASEEPVVAKPRFHKSGVLTNASLAPAQDCVNGPTTIADVLSLIRLGLVYVQVDSVEFPHGVLRAQIFN